MQCIELIKKKVIEIGSSRCMNGFFLLDASDASSIGAKIISCSTMEMLNELGREYSELNNLLEETYWILQKNKIKTEEEALAITLLGEEGRLENILDSNNRNLTELVISDTELVRNKNSDFITELLRSTAEYSDKSKLVDLLTSLSVAKIKPLMSQLDLIYIGSKSSINSLKILENSGVDWSVIAYPILNQLCKISDVSEQIEFFIERIENKNNLLNLLIPTISEHGQYEHLSVLSKTSLKVEGSIYYLLCHSAVSRSVNNINRVDEYLSQMSVDIERSEDWNNLGLTLLIEGFNKTSSRILGDLIPTLGSIFFKTFHEMRYNHRVSTQGIRDRIWAILLNYTGNQIADEYSNFIGSTRITDWFSNNQRNDEINHRELFVCVFGRIPFDFVYKQKSLLDEGKILIYANYSGTAMDWLNSDYAKDKDEFKTELGKLVFG